LHVPLQQGLGIPVRAEACASSFQLAAQLVETVDLAVEDERASTRLVGTRLIRCAAGIDDREPAKHQRPTGFCGMACRIRAAMIQITIGAGQKRLREASTRFEECGESVHQASPASSRRNANGSPGPASASTASRNAAW